MEQSNKPHNRKQRNMLKQSIIRLLLELLIWLGGAILYYFAFSLFFDTPVEYSMRHSTDALRTQYKALNERFDSLSVVLDNVSARDRNMFHILFDAEPYSFDSEYEQQRLKLHERIITQSSRRISRDLQERIKEVELKMRKTADTHETLQSEVAQLGSMTSNIPSIQPVINQHLTLLTAGYGMLMHPFYRTLQSHQGVDYTIPEGSRVFATADGVIKEISGKNSTTGLTVIIDHGNGYATSYSHLLSTKATKGQRVRRGDIIAMSGNTGLSLSPHLHYEVRYNGVRVDPVHYFFMELSADEYRRMLRIAQAGMQSFD